MARTANRYLNEISKEKEIKTVYRAGSYLRLSVDSDYTGSDSLENQRKLAREYADKCPDIMIVKEYVDNGKTGTNFSRPAFFCMMEDLKQGTINCVIVKDLSRFGREYIEAGNYIEKVFPFLGVRFISVVDRYDSMDADCDRELLLLALKNLMHEMYAKDISKKIRAAFQVRWEKKIFRRASNIPYGYQMDEENKNYCVDEKAAAIVREIYAQYSEGESKYSISHWLYEHRVVNPQQYQETGNIFALEGNELKSWSTKTIQRILKSPVYVGKILMHQTEQNLSEDKRNSVVRP